MLFGHIPVSTREIQLCCGCFEKLKWSVFWLQIILKMKLISGTCWFCCVHPLLTSLTFLLITKGKRCSFVRNYGRKRQTIEPVWNWELAVRFTFQMNSTISLSKHLFSEAHVKREWITSWLKVPRRCRHKNVTWCKSSVSAGRGSLFTGHSDTQ